MCEAPPAMPLELELEPEAMSGSGEGGTGFSVSGWRPLRRVLEVWKRRWVGGDGEGRLKDRRRGEGPEVEDADEGEGEVVR